MFNKIVQEVSTQIANKGIDVLAKAAKNPGDAIINKIGKRII